MEMATYRADSEEEALFRSYPYPLYFVQSPSAGSHANYEHSPINDEAARLALSRYSSSRESNNFFLQAHHKKKPSHERDLLALGSAGKCGGFATENDDREEEDDDDNDDDEERGYWEENRGWTKYFSFSYSNSGWWILLQLSWRFLLSFMVALVVFYVAAKPPAPKFSVEIARIREFRLAEGVDASGVTTKMLSCNISIDVTTDNNSKLFALHVHPPIMQIFFGDLPFATLQGREVCAGSDDITLLRLKVGTRNKAMYGAGRSMQDLLDSGKGLPLMIRVNFRSSFNVVRGIIQSKFHHEAQCLVIIGDKYDKKHRTQVFNSKCAIDS